MSPPAFLVPETWVTLVGKSLLKDCLGRQHGDMAGRFSKPGLQALVQAPDCLTCRNQSQEAMKPCVVEVFFIHSKLKIHIVICTYQTTLWKWFQLVWFSGWLDLEDSIKALLPETPTRGASGQRERRPMGRAEAQWSRRFPGGVPTYTACKHPHGLAVVPRAWRILNYVLSGDVESPWCKLRLLSERVGTWTASQSPALRAGFNDITSRAPS